MPRSTASRVDGEVAEDQRASGFSAAVISAAAAARRTCLVLADSIKELKAADALARSGAGDVASVLASSSTDGPEPSEESSRLSADTSSLMRSVLWRSASFP